MKNKLAEKLFAKMKQVIEAPGYPLLQSFKNDFYAFDRECLGGNHAPGLNWLWVVTPNGTHMHLVGVTDGESSWARAALNTGYKGCDFFKLSEDAIKRLEMKEALALANASPIAPALQWVGNSAELIVAGSAIGRAHKSVTKRPQDARVYGAFKFEVSGEISLRTLTVLRFLAQSEMTKISNDLFGVIEEISVNDKPLLELRDALMSQVREQVESDAEAMVA